MMPPRWLHRLVRWCTPSSRPDLEGDFLELYEEAVVSQQRWLTHLHWTLAALRMLPLRLIIPSEKYNRNNILMLRTYVKIGRRNLMKSKLYTAINVLGLALGLAACLLITFFVSDEFSYDRHFATADRVYRITGESDTGGDAPTHSAQTTYLLKPAIEGVFGEIEDITRVDVTGRLVEVGEHQFEETDILLADSAFFSVFPHTFLSGDAQALFDPSAAVLTREVAKKYFGTAEALGKTFEIEEKVFQVAAVVEALPHNTHFTADLYLPIPGITDWYPDWVLENNSGYSHYTYFKGPENLDKTAFADKLNEYIGSQWRTDMGPWFSVQSLTDIHLTSDLSAEILANGNQTIVYIFSATALIILLLAIINYINLSMAASLQRSKEVGLKKVLGASRLGQIMQFQVESILVVTAAALLALVMVGLAMPSFNQITQKQLLLADMLSPGLIAALLGVILLVGLITGSAPALFLMKLPTIKSLMGNVLTRGNNRFNLRNGLVTVQFFMAVTLIVSTLSIFNQIHFLRNKDLGYNPQSVVMIPLQTWDMVNEYETFRDRLEKESGVISVSASSSKPTNRIGGWRGYKTEGAEDPINCPTIVLDYNFFNTLEAEVADGRTFDREFTSDATEAYVLNQAAVDFFGLTDPVGASLTGAAFTGSDWNLKEAQVIGVVEDFHFASLHDPVRPTVFSLRAPITTFVTWVSVRLAPGNTEATLASLGKIWKSFGTDRDFRYEFMEDELRAHYQQEETVLQVLSTFTVLSVFIGCLGLFGITAFVMKRRTKEIGIRKVLGAPKGKLIALLSRDFLMLILIANLLGWPLAYYFMQDWVQNFAYQAPFSWGILALTGTGALLVGFLTILFHTLRVTRANPVTAIRYE